MATAEVGGYSFVVKPDLMSGKSGPKKVIPLMMKSLVAFICLGVAPMLLAQTSNTNCTASSTSCASNQQNLGDTTNTATATNSNSSASQAGNSTASNASGVTISPTSNNKVAQDSTNTATNTTQGTISGGNTTSGATGGKADGNQSSNTNSTGASTSNSGGNKLSTGPSNANATTGNNKNQNSVSGGNNTATNTARGGAGGSGVSKSTSAGGAGGSAAGGSALAAGGLASGGQSSANGTNSIDASNHGVSNTNVKVTYIPPVVPETPPSNLAVGNVVVETSTCGPLQRVIHTPVEGTFFGLVKKSKVPQGVTDDLAPYIDESGLVQEYKKVPYEEGYILYGSQVTQYTAILGVSGAKNIALGGGGSSGSWGQGGVGTSSANQQLVTKIILRSCEAGRIVTRHEEQTDFVSPAYVAPPVIETTPVYHDYQNYETDNYELSHKKIRQ